MRLATVMGAAWLSIALPARAETRFVAPDGGHVPPFTNWADAATNIQDAVDACDPGDLVLVTNGVYASGGRVAVGALTNRIVITNAITVASVNGPEGTEIVGAADPVMTNGDAAVRCVFLGNGSTLFGFTVRGGHTDVDSESIEDGEGGGVWGEPEALITNCLLSGNAGGYGGASRGGRLWNCRLVSNSAFYGGGAYGGALANCLVEANRADYGGGSSGTVLSNCMVRGNHAISGGGVDNGELHRCGLWNNSASAEGGGAEGNALLRACVLIGNSAFDGGGASGCDLQNCTISGNRARHRGGGVVWGSLNNCVVQFNTAPSGSNHFESAFAYSCTAPLPPGDGNLTDDPGLAGPYQLSPASPCRGAGDNALTAETDFDDEAWSDPPAMGCDEPVEGALTGELAVAISTPYTHIATGFTLDLAGLVEGRVTNSFWDLGDGTAHTNQPFLRHTFSTAGAVVVTFTACNEDHPDGVTATAVVQVVEQPVHYVDPGCTNPVFPYLAWDQAATNLQDAVDAALIPGSLVLVAAGGYDTGGRVVVGLVTNRVAITAPIVVRSQDGAATTVIAGAADPLTTNGPAAVRCVYLGDGARLEGFTLTGGHTREPVTDPDPDGDGGGAWCDGDATLAHCRLIGNEAIANGGGAYGGQLIDCLVQSNRANWGGGGYYVKWLRCEILDNTAGEGGGAWRGEIWNSRVSGNVAEGSGGGLYETEAHNSVVAANAAAYSGGGSAQSLMYNCNVVGNRAGEQAAGAAGGALYNCIVYFNIAPTNASHAWAELSYCCTSPETPGDGNITNDPLLVSAGRLSADSPCRGAGLLQHASGTDLDGDLWSDPPSIGCDEYVAGGATGELGVAISAAPLQVPIGEPVAFAGLVSGRADQSFWDFGDGFALTNQPFVTHAFAQTGTYDVVFGASNEDVPDGVTTTARVEVTSEVIGGPLSVAAAAVSTNGEPGAVIQFTGFVTGAATSVRWDFGDGSFASNALQVSHAYTSTGAYEAVFTAFNEGNPTGVSASVWVQVVAAVTCHYVNVANAAPVWPYTSWETAATTIQDAVDAALTPGVLILVTNGVYAIGGRAVSGGPTNRVLLDRPVLVRSVNGPMVTRIEGAPDPVTIYGDAAVRAVCLTTNAILDGFAIAGGATRGGGSSYVSARCGGGVWSVPAGRVVNCEIADNRAAGGGGGAFGGLVSNCVFRGNQAGDWGGGSYSGVLHNCALTGNIATEGGGAAGGVLQNCTVVDNAAHAAGGGVVRAIVRNSIVYYNRAARGGNHADCYLNHCCTLPLTATSWSIDVDPQLVDAAHIATGSPCVGLGYPGYTTGRDLDGETWGSPPAAGCDQPASAGLTGSLSVAISATWTQAAVGFACAFAGQVTGRASESAWSFGDGAAITNHPFVSHAFATAGIYAVTFTARNTDYPQGVAATTLVEVVAQPVHYVDIGNANPVPPYTNWLTAATTLQDAVDTASVAGAQVLVSNGVYDTGGRAGPGGLTNRVLVTLPLDVRSVNGPESTIIVGATQPGGTRGPAAIRCVLLGERCRLSGFTLTNGHTLAVAEDALALDGGGLWCGLEAEASNCVLAGCSAARQGGGMVFGRLYNSRLTGNAAGAGGGAANASVLDTTILGNVASNGGGAYACALDACMVISNAATVAGGGADAGTLVSCLLVHNTAGTTGGGARGVRASNCTVTGNEAPVIGGIASGTYLFNSIVYYNTNVVGSANNNVYSMWFCCVPDFPPDSGPMVIGAPRFNDPAAGDYTLRMDSPCVEAGRNETWMYAARDVAGRPRVLGSRVDLGAHEHGVSARIRGWLAGPTNTVPLGSFTLPLTSPYAGSPATIAAAPTNAVDWVLFSLRPTATSAPSASVSALLLADGRIMGSDGGSNLYLTASGAQYGVLQHRNHLAVMTAAQVFSNGMAAFDFSADPNLLWGGSNAVHQVSTNRWGLIPADADGDGQVWDVDDAIRRSQTP